MEVEKVDDSTRFISNSYPVAIVNRLARGSHGHIWNGTVRAIVPRSADASPSTSRLGVDRSRSVASGLLGSVLLREVERVINFFQNDPFWKPLINITNRNLFNSVTIFALILNGT